MELAPDMREVFAREYASSRRGQVLHLPSGGELVIGDRYEYDDWPGAAFPHEGKVHRYATVGRAAPWAIDAAGEILREGEGYLVLFPDEVECLVRIGQEPRISCSCEKGDRQCAHALGALYLAAAAQAPAEWDPAGTHRHLIRAVARARRTRESVDLVAAADAGYVHARHYSRLQFAPRTTRRPLTPGDDLATVLFG